MMRQRATARAAATAALVCAAGMVAGQGERSDTAPIVDERTDVRLAWHIDQARDDLGARVLPFWASGVQRFGGGFAVGWDQAAGRVTPSQRGTLAQAGVTWAFAHATVHGLAPVEVDPWGMVRHGTAYLLNVCRDDVHGGFYEAVSISGGVADDSKHTRTQAAAIAALVEAFRVTGDEAALNAALDTARLVDTHLRDRSSGGWVDSAAADWSRDGHSEIKRAETHLAMLEALTALAGVTSDDEVDGALRHAVDIVSTRFFPREASKARRRATTDWAGLPGELEFGPTVYGLHASAARAIAAGTMALGREPDWSRVRAVFGHALGHLQDDGPAAGVALVGYAGRPPMARARVWWAQAEVISAAAFLIEHRPELRVELEPVLAGVLDWYNVYQLDQGTGVPIKVVDVDGTPIDSTLAGPGKFGMLDVRARAAVARLDASSPVGGG
jgi:mannose/cellobiose epimerase-like protein (N-acyl-D-glucosamine 2-epimerase family)